MGRNVNKRAEVAKNLLKTIDPRANDIDAFGDNRELWNVELKGLLMLVLRDEGFTLEEIGGVLGLHHSTISWNLERVRFEVGSGLPQHRSMQQRYHALSHLMREDYVNNRMSDSYTCEEILTILADQTQKGNISQKAFQLLCDAFQL